ncbi:(2,3-dihydroxybenzoyl)adenylate synthase [Halobacterium noricense]|uniref:(2,3-dihydroxybenzoyl)adenylate synthase n=1 Tax=Halobacterium noricense TaxID=223182 RepID=UPI001E30DE35|nr:AMP-binding protein [Halobacterium noricense]UHH24007.1 AMP-binding protein [Halobacterium noricense]
MSDDLSPASLEGYVPFPQERIDRYRDAGYWRDLTFHELLDQRADETPEKVAVTGPNRELTYAELAKRSRSLATALNANDVTAGERVIFQLPNSVEFLEAFFGCSRVGAIPVQALPRHREAEVRHLLDNFDTTAYLTAGDRYEMGFDFVSLVDNIESEYPHLETLIGVADDANSLPGGWEDFDSLCETTPDDERLDSLEISPTEPGVMLLSGGTTGMPKGIPRTHNDYLYQWEHMADVAGVDSDWVAFPSVPIGHNASLNCIVGAAIWEGATVAVEPTLKPEALMDLIEREGGMYSLFIPTQLIDILEHPDLDEYDLSSLEVIISGGQKVLPHVVRDSVDAWDVGFCNIFGMAEGPLICTRPEDDVDIQAETVGRPISDGAEVRIVGFDREETVPQGETGELSVRGPGYFTGYFRNDEENADNFDDDGWLYTEDVLSHREDGNYAVFGRIKNTIIRGGENIYAPGVEDIVAEHPDIANVAIVAMPDERLGERPCAFVELTEDATPLTLDDLTEFLEERGVAVFKRPERLEVMRDLPRTEVGKLDKKRLEELAAENAN